MPFSQAKTIICVARSVDRIRAAREFLEAIGPESEALVVADNPAAADDLVRAIANQRGAAFGIHRITLNRLIFMLASERMAAAGVSPLTNFGAIGIAARATFSLRLRGEASYFDSVMNHPGFAEAIAATREDLSLNRLGTRELDGLDAAGTSLAAILRQFDHEAATANLLDRAGMIDHAIGALAEDTAPPFAGIPTLLLDLPIENLCERDLIAALASRAPRLMATVAAGDER